MFMKEIRIHGRGGQGAVTAAQLIAIAALHDGKYAQAFPMFGVERRGAPVQAFARIDARQIRTRQQVYEPDYVIVLDASLVATENVTAGMKKSGIVIVNSDKTAKELKFGAGENVRIVNAAKIASDVLGKPIVNTAILGAFSAITNEVSMEALEKAIDERFAGKKEVAEQNKEIIRIVGKQCMNAEGVCAEEAAR